MQISTLSNGVWGPYATVPMPGRLTFSQPLESTRIKKILVNGNFGRIRPITTWNNNEIRLAWPVYTKNALKDSLESYIKSGSALRLQFSSNEIFYGRFTRFAPEWMLAGRYPKYKFEIILDTYKQEIIEAEGI